MTEGQTDKQIDRQSCGQLDRKTDKQSYGRQTELWTDRQTDGQRYSSTDRQTVMWMDKQMDIQIFLVTYLSMATDGGGGEGIRAWRRHWGIYYTSPQSFII